MALQKISEARRVLQQVVTSSESFDYPRAKEGLKELDRMIRELGREEARLRGEGAAAEGHAAGNKVVAFPLERSAG